MKMERLLVKMRVLKPSTRRRDKIENFVEGYQDAVYFLAAHKGKIFGVCLFTFLQRCSVFVLTWIIYRGFSLEGADMMTVASLPGVGIYCRRYASGAGRAGNYGAYVPQYLWRDFYRQLFDAVIVCDARDQFLFSLDCRNRSNIRQLSVQKAD